MKYTTKVKNLIAQLETCDCYEVVGDSPYLDGLNWAGEVKGDPNNETVLITWNDEEGLEYNVVLTEKNLSQAHVSGNNIFCEDQNGDDIHIRLWLRLWRRVDWPAEELLKHGDNLDVSAIDKL